MLGLEHSVLRSEHLVLGSNSLMGSLEQLMSWNSPSKLILRLESGKLLVLGFECSVLRSEPPASGEHFLW